LTRVNSFVPAEMIPTLGIAAYRLGGTPATIVVSPEGKLLREWKGAYMGDAKHQIEEYFDVSFPVATGGKE